MNFMRASKARFRVLNLGQGCPQYQYKLEAEGTESRPAEKKLRLLVDENLDMSWQSVFATQKEKHILGYIQSSVTSREVRGRDSAPLLCSGKTPPAVLHPAMMSQHRKDMGLLEQVQRRDKKMIRRTEHLCYEERLGELGLFILKKRRLQRKLILTSQYLEKLMKEMGMDFVVEPAATDEGEWL